MVNFRFHVVSLAAVLLALAAGVVLGAGPLDAQLAGGSDSVAQLQDELAARDAQEQALQARVSYDDAAAAALAPAVLPKRLKDRTVAVVVTPGTPPAQVDALTAAVRAAGGTLTGVVEILPTWVDPEQGTVLGSLAEQLAPEEFVLPSGGVYASAGAALAAALVTNEGLPSNQPDETSIALLTGFEEGGFIVVNGDPAVRAQLALVVAPSAPAEPDDGTTASTLLPLVGALDAGLGSVLAGAEGSSLPGGLVAALRESGPLRRIVSSNDMADVASGVIGTVLALQQQAGGTTGQYGIGPGADAAMPPLSIK